MHKLMIAATAATALFAGPVLAGDTVTPRAEWIKASVVAQQFEEKGYVVQQIESARDAWKIKAMDANGMWIEAYLDPMTGAPLKDGKKK